MESIMILQKHEIQPFGPFEPTSFLRIGRQEKKNY